MQNIALISNKMPLRLYIYSNKPGYLEQFTIPIFTSHLSQYHFYSLGSYQQPWKIFNMHYVRHRVRAKIGDSNNLGII